LSRVLYLDNLGADYGSYFLYHGFVKLLGADRVIDWPYKRTFHGGHDRYPNRTASGVHLLGPTGTSLWRDPKLYRAWTRPRGDPTDAIDGPIRWYEAIDAREWGFDEILAAIRAGEIKLIVLASPRWFNSIALHEIRASIPSWQMPPIVFVDGEDPEAIRGDFLIEFRPLVAFKRTLLDRDPENFQDSGVPMYPLPFSSMWDIPWVPWAERTTDVFCVFGNTQANRPRIRDAAVRVAGRRGLKCMASIGHPMSHPEYLQALAHSRVVIDHQASGSDTVRTWEALSAGACMLTDMKLTLPTGGSLEDGVHLVRYPTDRSQTRDRQDIPAFEARLDWALSDPARAEAIARAGYERLRSAHRTVGRARYVLEKARKHGAGLGDLLG